MANSNIPILFVGQEYKDQYCLVHDDYDAAYELGHTFYRKAIDILPI